MFEDNRVDGRVEEEGIAGEALSNQAPEGSEAASSTDFRRASTSVRVS